MNGHPQPFIETLTAQKNNYDDGLYHRFFISCPKMIIRDSAAIMSATDPCVDLDMILFYVFRKNKNGNSMVLEDDASLEFNKIFDMSKKLLGKFISIYVYKFTFYMSFSFSAFKTNVYNSDVR